MDHDEQRLVALRVQLEGRTPMRIFFFALVLAITAIEGLEVILKAWTSEGRFSHHGKFWHFSGDRRRVVRSGPRYK
jgi:hypothetical protein